MIEHNYTKDFDTLKSKLETGENFAFLRFSDGEGFILYNQYLIVRLLLCGNNTCFGNRFAISSICASLTQSLNIAVPFLVLH